MPGRHIDATMDGVALPSGIIIREVHEDAPTMEILNGERPGRAGQLMLGRKRQSLKVTLECVITEIFNLRTRAEKAQALAQWANGSVLTLSNHYQQRLNGYLSAVPSLGEVRDYNSPLRVEFTADVIPYWENTSEYSRTSSLQSGFSSFTVPGTAPTPVRLEITPTGGTMTDFAFQVAPTQADLDTVRAQKITLGNMTVSTSQTIYIDRDERDSLYIKVGSAGAMSLRTPESADDLIVYPKASGGTYIKWSSNVAHSMKLYCRGRWL